jgi:phosphoribosylaminoimidazole-succinocarboxamide synthase
VEQVAERLFERGQTLSAQKGLLLVDTKYEFGLDEKGNLTLIDEVHTPDSSRFWEASTYADRLSRNESPQAFDKEGIRDWMSANCSKADLENPEFHPDIPDDVMNTHAAKYRELYKRITGKSINE